MLAGGGGRKPGSDLPGSSTLLPHGHCTPPHPVTVPCPPLPPGPLHCSTVPPSRHGLMATRLSHTHSPPSLPLGHPTVFPATSQPPHCPPKPCRCPTGPWLPTAPCHCPTAPSLPHGPPITTPQTSPKMAPLFPTCLPQPQSPPSSPWAPQLHGPPALCPFTPTPNPLRPQPPPPPSASHQNVISLCSHFRPWMA